jgi:hypothetical protein
MLKIATADKPWLQQMVLAERRRLAGLHRAALMKVADQSPNDPEGYAVQSHEEAAKDGETIYDNAMDPKVGSVKQAAELKYDESGTPPNTETATQDHDFELKALAKQIQGFMGGKTEWDPNDPLKD